jgi:predicted RND superfamily exporter protein
MKAIRSFGARYVALATRHPLALLLVFTALTALAAVGTVRVFGHVRTNIRDLLPENTPSRRALEESDERRGSSDLYVIAVESPDAHANVAFVEALRERIETTWEPAEWVQVDEDPSFFREHALLYMPVERLERFRDELRVALRCELARVNPAYVELTDACEGQGEVEWTMDYWIGDDLMRSLGLPEEFFGAWDEDEGGDEAAAAPAQPGAPTAEGTGGAAQPALVIPEELGDYLMGVDETNGTFVSALYVQLDRPSTDVEFANTMQQMGVDLIAALDPTSFHPALRAEVRGAYQSLNEAREAVNDSMHALLASLGLIVLIMVGFFRAVRGLVIVIVPLIMGLSWTMGLTWLTFGELNLYTMFVGSVLLGMGIDFGIHVYGRAMEAWRRGETWEQGLTESLGTTAVALFAAAATTVGALLTLLVSHFKGFKEFGLIASYGVVFCMAAAFLVIPPLVIAFERVLPLPHKPAIIAKPRRQRSGNRLWYGLGAFTLLLTIGGVLLTPYAEFEHDFRNLRGEASHGGIRYGTAVGRGKATSASLILGNSVEQMREVHELLRARFEAMDPMLKGFVTIETYVPDGQTERMAVIRDPDTSDDDPFRRRARNDIASVVERSALDHLDGEVSEFVEVLRDMVDVEPFALEDIPRWATRTIREVDGTLGRIGLIFRNIQSWDARECMAYSERYSVLEVPSGEVHVADSTFITADVVSTVQADGERMALLVSSLLFVVLLIALRSVLGAIICMLTLGVAFALTAGAMVLTNTKVGMYNMIVLPAVLGVSIDGAIHLYHRFHESKDGNLGHVMRTTGSAVVAAALTTAGGFAGLLFQHHLGIRSIGELALIGILAALVAVFCLMPTLLLFERALRRRFARGRPA